MGEGIEKAKSIIIDTNIIFSSFVKTEGFTSAVLSVILSQKDIKVLIPLTVKTEIMSHIREISKKSGLPERIILNSLQMLLKEMHVVDEASYKDEITKALDYVKDKADSPFCGLAIKNSPSIILTYNVKDFEVEKLKTIGILVHKPKELVDYLDFEIKADSKVKRKKGIYSILSRLYLLKKAKPG